MNGGQITTLALWKGALGGKVYVRFGVVDMGKGYAMGYRTEDYGCWDRTLPTYLPTLLN